MTSVEFCYWLQGFLELGDVKTFDAKQVDLVRSHLAMVFLHEIDPKYPPEQQPKLNILHGGGSSPGPTFRC